MKRDDCAHAYAQQNKPKGKAGNCSFNGTTFYSYSTPIAEYIPELGLFVLNTYNYGSSYTSRHQCAVSRAVRYVNTWNVHVECKRGVHFIDILKHGIHNLLSILKGSATELAKLWCDKRRWEYLQDLRNVAAHISLGYNTIDYIPQDVVALVTRVVVNGVSTLDAELPETVHALSDGSVPLETVKSRYEHFTTRDERREENAKKREAKEEQVKLDKGFYEMRDSLLEAWYNGSNTTSFEFAPLGKKKFSIFDYKNIKLRLKGDKVETSEYASVKLETAKYLYERLIRNEQQIGQHVDNFTLNEVSDKSIRIGCHIISWDEINRFATRMGWVSL